MFQYFELCAAIFHLQQKMIHKRGMDTPSHFFALACTRPNNLCYIIGTPTGPTEHGLAAPPPALTLHCPSMYFFCDAELEMDVMEELGYFSARKSVSEPHPQPRSTI